MLVVHDDIKDIPIQQCDKLGQPSQERMGWTALPRASNYREVVFGDESNDTTAATMTADEKDDGDLGGVSVDKETVDGGADDTSPNPTLCIPIGQWKVDLDETAIALSSTPRETHPEPTQGGSLPTSRPGSRSQYSKLADVGSNKVSKTLPSPSLCCYYILLCLVMLIVMMSILTSSTLCFLLLLFIYSSLPYSSSFSLSLTLPQ